MINEFDSRISIYIQNTKTHQFRYQKYAIRNKFPYKHISSGAYDSLIGEELYNASELL